jgi:dihydropteroate synthase
VNISWNNFSLDFSRKTYVMGILNATPDSFSDGGLHFDRTSAVDGAMCMIDDGADIIDIGGESTRPGSDPAEVARRAIDAGASIVNDISGLGFDPQMPQVVARYGVPVVIMHMKGRPKDMQKDPSYAALIPEILDFFRSRIAFAANSGIPEDKIIIDPGIGFGKTFDHNLEIIHNLDKFKSLGRPVLIGPSRKAFIGRILGDAPAAERLEGTAAAVAISVMKGADIIRVHDVKEMARVVKVADAIKRK